MKSLFTLQGMEDSMRFLRRALAILLLWAAAFPAAAAFHLWTMNELYSSADGSVQFLELTAITGGQQFLAGHELRSVSGGTTHTFTFASNLPGDTSGRRFLVGTTGYAALSGVPSPDYVVPNGFFFPGGGTITFASGADTWTHGPTPSGNLSLNRNGSTAVNSPRNFAGQTGVIGGGLVTPTVSLTGPASSMQGASVTFTATVAGSSPTGTVQFRDGGSNLGGPVTLAGGAASRSVSTLTVGTHSISAAYSGDSAHSAATSNTLSHTVSAVAPPPPPGGGTSTKTLGSRATVSPAVTLFGGFELSGNALVYILVRGNSLGTLGVTQGFLDAPRVRIYNSQGQDIVSEAGGRAGFNGCSTSSSSATPVVNYYQNVRGQPAHDRDACIAQTLAPGPYTFTVTPSTPGVTTDSTASTPNAGEVLFEVILGSGGGSVARTLGSRATVAQAATLFGGFEIASNSVVHILVRGNSLGTLGVTQSFLDAPRVRLFDGQGRDLITDSGGSPGFSFCLASNTSQKPVFDFYSLVRRQAAEGRDACVAQALAPGVYTFSVTPAASSIPSSGEVLFEVTLGQ